MVRLLACRARYPSAKRRRQAAARGWAFGGCLTDLFPIISQRGFAQKKSVLWEVNRGGILGMSVGSCYGHQGWDSDVMTRGAIYFALVANVESLVERNA
jgi:hypothetical protein